MYVFTNTRTGRVYEYSTLAKACRAKDRQDAEYGAVCTTYPRFVAQ